MNFFERRKYRGLKIPNHKERTKNEAVTDASVPQKLYFPMTMHIGAPAKPTVEVGDEVQIGTLLGSAEKGVSANIRSSVSGKVAAIEERPAFRGETVTVVVDNDFEDREEELEDIADDLTPDEFVERLADAGITGKGGAGFPTSIKYDLDKHESYYLVVNGSECEPYSTTDYRVMVEYPKAIVGMAQLIAKIYDLKSCVLAVEDHMTDAIRALEVAIKEKDANNIRIHKLPSEYPAGHASLQIREVLGIEIDEGKRSGDVGVLQSNVSTLKAMYDAIRCNKSLTRRVVTVTGPMIEDAKNLMVRIGTPVQHLIDECGGLKGETDMINGGPMMGRHFTDPDLPVDKDTTTLLFLEKREKKEESPCIRCARCVDNCPVALQPIAISNSYRQNRWDRAMELRSESCISCGVCTYICPAHIDLLKDIEALNKKWEAMQSDD